MENFLFGLWNGATSGWLWWAHMFGVLEQFPVYHVARDGLAYQAGFLLALANSARTVATAVRIARG